MKITLEDAGKRYNQHWIFRHFNYSFQSQNAYAITGPNGSGKTTLLQVLSGAVSLNQGKCIWQINNKAIAEDEVNKHISISAPYFELVEEMTAKEFSKFHFEFKKSIENVSVDFLLKEVQLSTAADKQIRYFSSGMKQRLKLAQAIFSNVPAILLDEPCTNLDNEGIELYHYLIKKYCTERLIIICSNDTNEYSFCNHIINITDYKKPKQ